MFRRDQERQSLLRISLPLRDLGKALVTVRARGVQIERALKVLLCPVQNSEGHVTFSKLEGECGGGMRGDFCFFGFENLFRLEGHTEHRQNIAKLKRRLIGRRGQLLPVTSKSL